MVAQFEVRRVGVGMVLGEGVRGIKQMRSAKRTESRAAQAYELSFARSENRRAELDEKVRSYFNFQVLVRMGTCKRFIDFVERIGRSGIVKPLDALGSIGLEREALQDLEITVIEAGSFVAGGFGAVSAGAATVGATTTCVSALGTASTGTAISTLSGAAASNSTLAWLGGGALASGGGGMALGTVVLGAVAAGPGLLVLGCTLSSQGEKALTRAEEKRAAVEIATAELDALADFMVEVGTRIDELQGIASALDCRAQQALTSLEKIKRFDIDDHEHLLAFQQAAVLVSALSDILRAPVLDEGGALNAHTACLIERLKRI